MATPAFTYGAYEVSKNVLMQREYTEEQRATMSSMTSFFGSLFYGAFALLMGLIADQYGPAKSLIMAQICMLYVLYINIRLKQLHYAHPRH